MKSLSVSAAALCFFSMGANAQTEAVPVASPVVPIVAVAKPSATAPGASLPANTEVWLSPNAEVNSKRIKMGEKFDMTVARDVVLGDYVVIPRGTKGYGQISYRTGKGAFGKSAKMEFEIVDIELNGRMIPVTGHYRLEGQGNTGATVGAVVAVGVFAAFVTGRSAVIPQGTEFKAFTTSALPVVLSAAPPTLVSTPVPSAPAVTATENPPVIMVRTQPTADTAPKPYDPADYGRKK